MRELMLTTDNTEIQNMIRDCYYYTYTNDEAYKK